MAALATAVPAFADDETVTFADRDLARCVTDNLGLEPGTPVTLAQMAALTDLSCAWRNNIGSLEGLETATHLRSLDLFSALSAPEGAVTTDEWRAIEATMLYPLSGMQDLELLNLAADNTAIYDLGVLATLPSLKVLYVEGLKDGDVSPIAAATHLTLLNLGRGDQVTDVSPLTSLQDLEEFSTYSLAATDLSPFTELPELEVLFLPYADATTLPSFADHENLSELTLSSSNVSDLGNFTGTGLTSLRLANTPIHSLEVVADATHLLHLDIAGTDVADLSPIENLQELTSLDANWAEVSDISGLPALSSLTTVDLDSNAILDISPLSELPALTDWTARYQHVVLPQIEACVPTELPTATDIDGAAVPLVAPNDGVAMGQTVVVPYEGNAWYRAVSASSPFDVTLGSTVVGTPGLCPWPAGWLPTAAAPSSLDEEQPAVVTFAGGAKPTPTHTTRWLVDGKPSATAVGDSFTPQSHSAGEVRRVEVTYERVGMQTATVPVATLTTTGHLPTTAALGFVNPPQATTDAVVDQSAISVRATTLTCVWSLSGMVVATNHSCVYPLPSSSGGKTLSVSVTASAPYMTSATYSVAPVAVLKSFGELNWVGRINESAPSSVVDPGAKLVAKNPTYKLAAPTTFSYQWTRNGSPIPGATAATYTVTSADAGTKIGLTFTAARTGYGSSTTEAIDVFTVRKAFAAKPTPAIAGTKAVGYTLTASRGAWSPAPTSWAYQWYRNGKAISGATKSTYKATTADGGAKITLRVTAKKSGYTTAYKTSAAVTILKRLTSTPTPTITGTVKVKSTLTAKTGTWAPGSVTKSYQWYRNGKAISGATKSTYKVSVKDAYASITVRVTGKKAGYLSVGKTSSAKVPAGTKYANCPALLVDYPGGIAKSSSTIDKINGVNGGGILSTTYVSSTLYTLNASRDRDKDGWACEPN